MTRWQRFLCWSECITPRHAIHTGYDNMSATCSRCGRQVLWSSQGWFHATPLPLLDPPREEGGGVKSKPVLILWPHYKVISVQQGDGMNELREMFKDGEADDLNFCLFSTSGIHGSYNTLESVERCVMPQQDANAEEYGQTQLTFLIVQPRLVVLRYGNCEPMTTDDFSFLRKLRASTFRVFAEQLSALDQPRDATES